MTAFPSARFTQPLKPSQSASNAGRPAVFRNAHAVDFPVPEVPVTHISGIGKG